MTLDIEDGSPIDLAVDGDTVYLAADSGIAISVRAGEWGPLVPPDAVAAATRVAAGPDAAVAAGLRIPADERERDQGEHPSAAWRLDDGSWVLAPISAPLTDFLVNDIAWDGAGFVAVGVATCSPWWFQAQVEPRVRLASTVSSAAALGCPGRDGDLPMRWTSPDGGAWTADADPPERVGGIGSIAAGPRGVVAGGYLGDPGGEHRPAVWWRAADGRWEVQSPPAEGSGDVTDIEMSGDLVVAVGADAAGPAAWRATGDGTWQRSGLGFPADKLAPIPGGLLAMGLEVDDESEPLRIVLAATRDGIAWTRLPDDTALAGLEPADLVVTGQRVVLAVTGPGTRVLEADLSSLGVLATP